MKRIKVPKGTPILLISQIGDDNNHICESEVDMIFYINELKEIGHVYTFYRYYYKTTLLPFYSPGKIYVSSIEFDKNDCLQDDS